IKDLAELEIIAVSTPRVKAPCTYSLLSIGNGCRTFGNGDIQRPLPSSIAFPKPFESLPNQEKKKATASFEKSGTVMTEPSITELNGRPFTEDELVAFCWKDFLCDYEDQRDGKYLRGWLCRGEKDGWRKIRDWQSALRTYFETCKKREHPRRNPNRQRN